MLPRAILAPGPVSTTLDVAPVHNVLAGISGLSVTDKNPGISPWLHEAAVALGQERLRRNSMFVYGLGLDALANAVPFASDAEFPAYLAALSAADAPALRDRLLADALAMPRLALLRDIDDVAMPTAATALRDPAAWIAASVARAGEARVNADERAALAELHTLLVDPAALQAALVEHFGHLWRAQLAAEWARVAPLIASAVDALRTVDTHGKTAFEAIRVVTGRDLGGLFRPDRIARFRRLRLIPSLHTGPYTVWSTVGDELLLVFGARVPAARRAAMPDLDRAELLHRLRAVADDTRLAILAALAAEDELATATLQERFQLSSSAASRHLRQLVASGLITERREDGAAKFYRLAPRAVDRTLQRLGAMLAPRGRPGTTGAVDDGEGRSDGNRGGDGIGDGVDSDVVADA